jgi:hypothetical protein
MKIRNGFVSNSSSSSFVILGAKLSRKEEKEISEKYTEQTGKELCDQDFFLPDERNCYIGKIICDLHSDGDSLGDCSYCIAELECEIIDVFKELGIKKDIQLHVGTRLC